MDVTIFEEHSSVLPALWCRGVTDRTLICLDAHLDLQPINLRRLALLQSCVTKEQVKALEKPHHMAPDRGYAYSLEDWLYPANRLGLFHRLFWVVPPHVKVDFSEQVLGYLRQMDGVTPAEIAGFRALPSGGFAGTLAGVDIAICSYREVQGLPLRGEIVIDIDTDFFTQVPGDRAWVNPREVFDALDPLSLPVECVTISRSAGSGFLPLKHRYFADYLAALWQRREADAAHYERLLGIEQKLLSRDASRAAADALEQELLLFPECAATWYLRSTTNVSHEDSIAYRDQAEHLCEGYRTGLLTLACAYPQRQLPLDRQAVRRMERLLIEEPLSADRRALTQAALGMIYCAVGRTDAAVGQYRQCAAQLGAHPGLALEIGKLLVATRQPANAVEFLHAALADDKSRTAALVCLAQIYRDRGDLQKSFECANAALDAAPAWDDVMQLRDNVLRRLNQSQSQHSA